MRTLQDGLGGKRKVKDYIGLSDHCGSFGLEHCSKRMNEGEPDKSGLRPEKVLRH